MARETAAASAAAVHLSGTPAGRACKCVPACWCHPACTLTTRVAAEDHAYSPLGRVDGMGDSEDVENSAQICYNIIGHTLPTVCPATGRLRGQSPDETTVPPRDINGAPGPDAQAAPTPRLTWACDQLHDWVHRPAHRTDHSRLSFESSPRLVTHHPTAARVRSSRRGCLEETGRLRTQQYHRHRHRCQRCLSPRMLGSYGSTLPHLCCCGPAHRPPPLVCPAEGCV